MPDPGAARQLTWRPRPREDVESANSWSDNTALYANALAGV